MRIIKRNGSETAFDRRKIANAINGANAGVDEADRLPEIRIEGIAKLVEMQCARLGHIPTVEEVQDLVEGCLMESGNHEVARRYITYRYIQGLKRQKNTTDDRILSLIEHENEEAKQENSNKNPMVVSVQRDYMAGEVSRDITMRKLLPEDVVRAHEEGIIHFHDADYFIQPMFNCFSGGTKFITADGVRKFCSFKDGETAFVKDMHGDIREATVHVYGKQEMQRVTLKNQKMERTIICTPNHRWFLRDGTVTTDLKVGDRLYLTEDSTGYEIRTYDEAVAFCTGFVIGDGCDHSGNGEGYVTVRLCGGKLAYREYFEMAGYRCSPLSDTDDVVMRKPVAFKQNFLNGKAWRHMTAEQKSLCFKGYYAADGARDSNRLSTADERLCDFIEETSGIAGYYISSVADVVRDTNYKENSRLITYHFIKCTPPNWNWTVSEITPYGHGEVLAYCVDEPVTHSFTLESGIVTGNCCLINLEDMLQNGTVISGTMIEKPHSFSTACNIATQIIAQVASCQYGGQSISLTHLAPFVDVSRNTIRDKVIAAVADSSDGDVDFDIVDKIVEERVRDEVAKGVQTIQYQVITLMTTNGQAPFLTVFLYLNEARNEQEKADLAMIIEEVLRQRYQGVKNEKGVWITPAFPKLIYVLDEDNVHEGDPYFYLTELAAKCTARRMVPDYISAKIMRKLKLSKGEKEGEGDVYTCMGCRSFLTPDRSGNGWDNKAKALNYEPNRPKYYGRFNQGVVTINLPDVALSSEKDLGRFWEIFDERLELCHRALRCRHEHLLGTPSDASPIHWQYGALARLDKGEVIDPLLYGGYSTISLGYAGLYECVKYMTGYSHTDPHATYFALSIMQHMNDKCAEWKAAEDIDYSIYGTPIESTTYKFAKCLQRRFGVVEGITDHGYITNSYHVNVREEIDAFTKLGFESTFQHLSPGGAISYVEVPDMQDNIEAVIRVMQYIYDNIMYAELNTKSDYCQVCGYDGEIVTVEEDGKLLWECPNCGNRDQSKMNVARRTCGYIGTEFWNQGRTEEIRDRKMHL